MGQQSSPLNPTFGGRIIKDDKNDRLLSVDSGNNIRLIYGKLPTGGYGIMGYNSTGVAYLIIGDLPDGTNGIAIAKPGVNILTAF